MFSSESSIWKAAEAAVLCSVLCQCIHINLKSHLICRLSHANNGAIHHKIKEEIHSNDILGARNMEMLPDFPFFFHQKTPHI